MKTLHSTRAAAQCLLKGNLIVYPTESVYGLGCLPDCISALEMLRLIKDRPDEEGWILIGSAIEQFVPYVEEGFFTQHGYKTFENQSLLHPTTWILPAAKTLHTELYDARGGIAIRLSSHPPIVGLCNHLNQCMISTSANFRGDPPIKRKDLLESFLRQLPLTIELWDRPLGIARRPSQIKNFLSGEVLR